MTEFTYGPFQAERDGGSLTAEASYRPDGKKAARRTWTPRSFDSALARWFATAADHDPVDVLVTVDGDGRVLRVRMADPPLVICPDPDPRRVAATAELGGSPNPYTFITTPPRDGLPPGLENGPPAPHGLIDPGTQWSGWLVLNLTARTPLLLPDPQTVTRDAQDHPTYQVRTGADGKPLIHGASVKGALRSAYEAVTDSRYGVFRGHDRPLAYRRPPSDEGHSKPEPARVEIDERGRLIFRICQAFRVPLYDKPDVVTLRKAVAAGKARERITRPGSAGWGELHGKAVVCTMRGRNGEVVAAVALADDDASLAGRDGPRKRGWLSVTGHSIANKTSERLFVAIKESPVQVADEHHRMWHDVLASYQAVAEQRAREREATDPEIEPSRHLSADGTVPDRLAEGDLVYLERSGRAVTAVSPVYIGRMPFSAAPAELLHESLRPATQLDELSPADRLFGWAPPQAGPGRAAASGYRGRLRVTSVTCDTADWRTDFDEPVTLAPLSSPKPTQFRFYAASDPAGTPVKPQATKDEGYGKGTGLRGRKAYWYPADVPGDYWTPGTGEPGGHVREWQQPPGAAPSQTSSHRGWVRAGTAFTVRLFIDAAPAAELAPLLWLATQDGSPLRLGAGKPLGFGAITVAINWQATELHTGQALRDCWTSLHRPDPSPQDQVLALAAGFEDQATRSPALAPVLEAFRILGTGLPAPAAYPRTRRDPEAETYRWFTANEKIKDGKPQHGFALPHILEPDQNLPHITPE